MSVARFALWKTGSSTDASIATFGASRQLDVLRAAKRVRRNTLIDRFASPGTPNVSERALPFAFCCFPHASPVLSGEAGKQKTAPTGRFKHLISLKIFGAGEAN